MLRRFAAILESFAQTLGAPGLLVVAFLDSSFLSLPEITDVLIVAMVVQHPGRAFYYAVAATIGSVAGCYALYALARKGGDAFLRRRFRAGSVDRGLGAFRRYGLLTIVVPAILPPPMPFKIFVLLAGVARVSPFNFLFATTIGRAFRYGGVALLAYHYGDSAKAFIGRNLSQVSLWLAIVIAIGGIGFILWRRRRRPASQESDQK
jgi:membrane protein YqaA with SNARE-associated domain